MTHTAEEEQFTVQSLSWSGTEFPSMGGKGADVKIILLWLGNRGLDQLAPSRETTLVVACLQSVAQFISVLDNEPMFMTAAGRLQAVQHGWNFLRCYVELAACAIAARRCRWLLRPKLHTVAEIIYKLEVVSYMNPKFSSCFMDEDFVGWACRLAKSLHPETVGLRSLQRYLAHLELRWLQPCSPP